MPNPYTQRNRQEGRILMNEGRRQLHAIDRIADFIPLLSPTVHQDYTLLQVKARNRANRLIAEGKKLYNTR